MSDPTMRPQIKKRKYVFLLFAVMIAVSIITVLIDSAIDCYQFCFGGKCFSSQVTILVYRNDVSPKDMDFLQYFRPSIGGYKYAADHLTGQLDLGSCSMEGHFSQFTTIPAQNKCAVIGSSGILLHSGCGKEINSYDFVIRVNLPPVRGYEDDVGFKTNLTLLNFQTVIHLHGNLTKRKLGEKLHDMYVDRVKFLNDTVLWYGKSMGHQGTRKRLQQSVEILKTTYQLPVRIGFNWTPLSPERFVGLKRLATSGFMTYHLAKSLCQSVTLYGFYPYNKDARGFHLPHHYYQNVPYVYDNPVHNFLLEFEKYKEYEKKGQLRMVTDKCADVEDNRRRTSQDHEKPVGDPKP